MQVTRYFLTMTAVPVDFQADPDGECDYDVLVTAAGFDPEATPPPAIGALVEPWRGHPAGAAIVGTSPPEDEPGPVVVVEPGNQARRAA